MRFRKEWDIILFDKLKCRILKIDNTKSENNKYWNTYYTMQRLDTGWIYQDNIFNIDKYYKKL